MTRSLLPLCLLLVLAACSAGSPVGDTPTIQATIGSTPTAAPSATPIPPTPTAPPPSATPAATGMQILWLHPCDPRESLLVCDEAREREEFQPFFATVRGLHATLTFTAPATLDDLRRYDVVVANFCTTAIR